MSKKDKIWLIIATSLTVVGMTIFVIAMSINKWDFSKLSTVDYNHGIYHIYDKFSNISVKSKTADVYFEISDTDECSVVVHDQDNLRYTVEVKGDTLVIDVVDERKWYEHIYISFERHKIYVSVPEEYYLSAVKAKASTGDIHMTDMIVDDIDLSVSTGNIFISNVDCKKNIKTEVSTGDTKINDSKSRNFISDGSTGDVQLSNVIVEGMLSIERSTGDVKFTRCDAGEIYVETSTGDITGSLLRNMSFYVEADTGDVELPDWETSATGRGDLITGTGDIKITIAD